ncbi:Cell division cycle protein [Zancudomyces culisetae]|uniref:Cell division cycle protein n=1 Tax=Zancudomyces culisetae TaxID=1213189 RepID=A0A1R1PYG5_ZANCU|nr:Cell division cycle protein [Zancudomyces culisetae]|eukprot:OMH85998.1 Cell division cycle protein [Zancudomyces culisetae]
MEEEKKGIQLSEPIQNEIQQAIEELGGKVIPRMGWSFPTDAGWIISTNGSIQCENVNQVMMVLKASDKISRDIEKPYGLLALSDNNAGDKFEIVLNRFINTDLGQEFRVFVRNKRVIAISKVDEEMPSQQGNVRVQSYDEIKSKIIKLFNKAIKEAIETSNYTFDVYIVSGNKGSRTYILGFKLFAPINSAKMFDWDELLTISEDVSEEDVEIRTAITSQNRGQRTGTTVSKRYPIQYPLELNSSKSLANIIDEMA